MSVERWREDQRKFDWPALSEPETHLEAGRILVEKLVQESTLVTERELRDGLFYQVRALKVGPIFPVLLEENRESVMDLSSWAFPMVIIPGGARALEEGVEIKGVRSYGVERVREAVGGLPLYGFSARPYRLGEGCFISTEICVPCLDALFLLKDGLLCFELNCGGIKSPYLTYRWVVDQEGDVLNEEVKVNLTGRNTAFFRLEEEEIFGAQAREELLVGSFTRRKLIEALDPFNLEGSAFLLSEAGG